MSRRLNTRAIAGALIVTLAYTPLLGSINGTIAAAQAVQNTTSQYAYDANGNLTQVTDPLARITSLAYDPLNRVTQHQQPLTGGVRPTIKYAYDALDQAATVTDPRNLVTGYTVDGLGNQSALASPDTGNAAQTHDLAGNILTSTDARGKTTQYSYDVLNRVTRIGYASGTATVFEYDGGAGGMPADIGHLTRMTDESGHTGYAYDAMGRLLNKVQTTADAGGSAALKVAYTYGTEGSATGKLASLTYPSGNRVNYSYDAAGRVNALTLNPAAPDGSTDTGTVVVLLSQIGYAPFGAVQSWDWGNHGEAQPSRVTRTFDLDGRITSYPLGNPANGGLLRTVAYDAASRITALTHNADGTPSAYDQSFGYDELDRLTSVVSASTSQAYAYDKTGNRTQVQYGGTAYANTIVATNNRLSSTAGPLPAKTNSFDGAGNLTGDGSVVYIYSDRGRLKRATKAGIDTDYLYNGVGERVSKRGAGVQSGVNYYAYGQNGELLGEYGAGAVAIQETVYLANTPVAVLTADGAGPYYVYADHIDTPRVIVRSADNAIVWRWDMADPFGAQLPMESPTGGAAFTYNVRFPGQLFDKETNNHYNYFRDYDPQTGRYVQSDPIGLAGGINTYGYVGANPLSYTDELGLTRGQRAISYSAPSVASAQGLIIFNQIRAIHPGYNYQTIRPSHGPGRDFNQADVNALSRILRDLRRNQQTNRDGVPVGQFVCDMRGNTMIEPLGGRTIDYPEFSGGRDTHTLFPNGSNFMRLNPIGHGPNGTPHGHGHSLGTGGGRRGQGNSLDIYGNSVPSNSAEAHWPIN